ncbi:hypothetical protein TBR22_A50770 [Luteitalea sp. TBR-22]|uniref:TrbI/VirB10 family protein n=1 Tax=Luteitalea sp. TBR-22 TaxID=2802971 RepID=UPI001AFBCE48|nr:TrbI/VirB10 family protein [Luteitalea sp. TBR-22]BCS35843.1 hypothetical protein TBR22_A50770 [Luteitalea sp. TBR-22]
MEQRALIASLVLGCVTAAGAGGYLAVRQVAPAPTASPAVDTAPAADPTEGTIADLGTSDAPVDARTNPLPDPAPAPTGDVKAASRPMDVPAPSRPVTRPTTAARPATTAPTPRPSSTPTPAPATTPAPRDEPTRSTWPAPPADTQASAPTQAPASRWPNEAPAGASSPASPRDRDATTADAGFPSRQPTPEPVDSPAPTRRLEDVTIPRDAVIGVQLETGASSERSKVEDPVRARVTRDVLANGTVVVPAGSKLLGSVTLVEEGGRIKERARLGVKFHTLVLADGTEVRLPTEVIYREGEEVAGRAAAKIGGAAIGGAILGAIMGGGKGAVIGAATGAGSGTGWAMAGDRKPAELRAGQSVTVRVSDSVTTPMVR